MSRLTEVLENQQDNYILPFFWQHGEEEAVLREYMNVIHNAGIGAVCVESRPHPDFCGPKWWQDMDVVIDEAKKLGMKIWILDDSHFPTGFANGAVEKAPNELTHQYMVNRTLEVSGPQNTLTFDVREFMKEVSLPSWMRKEPDSGRVFTDDELIGVYACPILEGETLGSPIDLTDRMNEDMQVRFDLGNGFFRIYVIYLTRKARGRNDYINFLDMDSCRLLIDAVYEPHYEHYGAEFGKTIAGFFSDEPPVGNTEGYQPSGPIGSPGQNLAWSKVAGTRLTKEFGSEEWKKALPYLWADGEDRDMQAKIRNAYMQMASKLVAECFSKQIGEWCSEHGVEYIGHMLEDCDMNSDLGISMGHYFRGLSGQHMAGIDNIGGQVMMNGQNVTRHDKPACPDEGGFYHYMLGKLGASHAAIDPKKKGRALCENLGAYGWQSGTKEQKYLMDHFMVRGINHFVPHAFTPAPFPDPDCPPHFYAHGKNPLYRAFGELMRYTNRVCHLLSNGHACPDAALLYNGESKWAGGADTNISACRVLTENQIDFHVIPSDVFEGKEYPFSFNGKSIRIHETEYPALIISGCDYLSRAAADFIAEAVCADYPVVFLDKKPVGISGASEEENIAFQKAISLKETVKTKKIAEELRKAQKIQVSLSKRNSRVTVYHYVSDRDYYFFLNETGEAYEGEAEVRAKGIPLFYRPWENKIVRPEYETQEEVSRVRLRIEPFEMLILVFGEESEEIADREVSFTGKEQKIKELSVRYLTAEQYLFMYDEAVLASEMEKVRAPFGGMQEKYPERSGYYIYETEILLQEGKMYKLCIEDLSESVEVFLNGESLGMKLQKPFDFILSGELVKERNTLRIEIATLVERELYERGVSLNGMTAMRPLSATGIIGEVVLREKITRDKEIV